MDIINNRRSVRQYKDKPISKEIIEKLVRAGMQAPSAKNQQPWRILVVTKKDMLIKLGQLAKFIENAGACFIIFYDLNNLKALEMVQCDLGACTQNILLECVNNGLGACWIGMNERPQRIEALNSIFNVPSNLVPFSVLSIGYPQDDEANHFIDRFDSSKVMYEDL